MVPIPVGITRKENVIELKVRLVIQHLLHAADYISSIVMTRRVKVSSIVLSSRVKVEVDVNQTKSEKDDAAHTD